MSNIEIIQSKNIHDYKPVLENLVKDFGFIYYHTILCWCGVIDEEPEYKNKYWDLWLIKYNNQVVGICGLYSRHDNNVDELWLGWFGIVPDVRKKTFINNLTLGEYVLNWMETHAKSLGCKKIMSDVDKNRKALNFYFRNGYRLVGLVGEYLEKHPELNKDDFEDMHDFVIEKE